MIRLIRKEEKEMIVRWWSSNDANATEEMIPDETYVMESDGTPWVAIGLVGLIGTDVAWTMGLISNPFFKKDGRKEAVNELWKSVMHIAKSKGYKNVMCVAPNKKLEKRYEELGFNPDIKNATIMIKNL